MGFWNLFWGNSASLHDSARSEEGSISWEEYYRRTPQPSPYQTRVAEERLNDQPRSALMAKLDFTASFRCSYAAIALDEGRRMIKLDSEVFLANEVVEIAVDEGGELVAKTSNASLVARAAVGGLLFGGLGLLVGGLTAKKTTAVSKARVQLRVLVNSAVEPLRIYDLTGGAVNEGGLVHVGALGQAKRIHAVVASWLKDV